MKQIKPGLRMLAVTIALVLPWSAAQALEEFKRFGMITDVGFDSFTVKGQVYRIRPTAELNSNDDARQKISDLRKGDLIGFRGNILGSRYYVDYIRYRKEEPS